LSWEDVNHFWTGVKSVPRGLYRFGDYLGRITGFRDYQCGSVVLDDYYQNQAVEETKYTYLMMKYILTHKEAKNLFFQYIKEYAGENKAYLSGRLLAGPVLGLVSRNPVISLGSTIGDISYKNHDINLFARKIILGY